MKKEEIIEVLSKIFEEKHLQKIQLEKELKVLDEAIKLLEEE